MVGVTGTRRSPPPRRLDEHLEFTALVFAGSLMAGLLGSLTGLGGGVVLVPLLTLFFKVDIRYAIGASLVSVIATSSGAAAAYVKEGFSNIRIGMFLEIATTLGALIGRIFGRVGIDQSDCRYFWRSAAVLRVSFTEAPLPGGTQLSARPTGHSTASQRQLPGPRRFAKLQRATGARRASASCLGRALCPDCSVSAPVP